MSGISEIEKQYRVRINNVLQKHKELKGYLNFLNNVSFRTQYNYLNIVSRFIENINKKCEDLSFDDFSGYIAELKYYKNGDSKTQSYLITVYSAIKRYCEYLYVSKKIPENYMLYIKRPKFSESQKTIQKRSNGFLTENEIKKLMRHMYDDMTNERTLGMKWKIRNEAIILLFLYTGMRCSALSSIDIDDIDFKNMTITVTEKGNKIRQYTFSKQYKEVLNNWINERKEIKPNTNALFITKRKDRISNQAIAKVIQLYTSHTFGKEKCFSPHKLRATYGTQIYNKTGDIYFVQDCMGHSSPKTTELYVRDKKQNTKKASEIMGKIIK